MRPGAPWVLLASALLGTGCFLPDPCGNHDAIRVQSPDESLSAWVFVRNCGATTRFSTQVSVLPASADPPRDEGNAFVIEEHESTVVAEWTGPRQLLIIHEPGGRFSGGESRIGDVNLSYRARSAMDLRRDSIGLTTDEES